MYEKVMVNAKTVKDLKRILDNYKDSDFINLGADKYAFEIDSVSYDGISVSLQSSQLSQYVK